MIPSARMTLHLAVVGAALVTAAVRPAEAASSWSVAAGAAPTQAVQPAPVPAPVQHVRPRPVHVRARHHAHRTRVRTVPRPHAVASAPATRHRVAPRRSTPRPVVRISSGPTGWTQLDLAIARIPSYHAGAARWIVSSRYGHWGTADWYHDTLYIEPTVPAAHVYDVAVHEWSHELSVLDYNGNVSAAVAAMDRYFGGSGLVGAERAADCMAILQGATWTHYTSCADQRWRAGAALLLRRQRL